MIKRILDEIKLKHIDSGNKSIVPFKLKDGNVLFLTIMYITTSDLANRNRLFIHDGSAIIASIKDKKIDKDMHILESINNVNIEAPLLTTYYSKKDKTIKTRLVIYDLNSISNNQFEQIIGYVVQHYKKFIIPILSEGNKQ